MRSPIRLKLRRWFDPRQSLRRLILWLLLPALVILMVLGQWQTYRALDLAVDVAYDRVLLGSLRAMESGVSLLNGQINILVPYTSIEMYESIAENQFYYRLTTEHNTLLTGYADLPNPPGGLVPEKISFYDGIYKGEAVRVIAYWKLLNQGNIHTGVKIYVAENQKNRESLVATVWRTAMWRDVSFIFVAALTIIFGIVLALRPLNKLQNDVEARAPHDLTPIPIDTVPKEVRPLVETINHHVTRSAKLNAEQIGFLANASHQLRTPLAILLTQAEYALRSDDLIRMRETLTSIVNHLAKTSRLTQQLLSLARAQQTIPLNSPLSKPVEGRQIVESVAMDYIQEARQHQHDFGIDTNEDVTPLILPTVSEAIWVQEAFSNLVHNAILYTPKGGRITLTAVRNGNEAWLTVEDNGPGIAEKNRHRVFERFVRLDNTNASSGSGLGLAIAHELIQHCKGRIQMDTVYPHGLKISLILPLA